MQENQYLAEEGVIILSLETLNMLASTPQMPLLIEKVIGKNRNSHKFKLYTPNELRVISKNDDITLTSCFSIQVPPQGAIYVLPNCNTPIPVIKSNTHLNLLPESHYVNLSMEIRNFDSQI
jgi:hypothetical protein